MVGLVSLPSFQIPSNRSGGITWHERIFACCTSQSKERGAYVKALKRGESDEVMFPLFQSHVCFIGWRLDGGRNGTFKRNARGGHGNATLSIIVLGQIGTLSIDFKETG
jgi:hypothetical protein